jgi:putative phosphoesterase
MLSVLDELRRLGPPVEGVHGNVDEPALRVALPERLELEAEGTRIGIVHDAGGAAGRHERLRGWFPECELVAYGHTHVPELALADGVWIVNPGSPTERRRAPTWTMAVVEAGQPRLVDLGATG